MSTNDGGPALGMSLRDFFAAKAALEEMTTFQAKGVMGEKPPQWPPYTDTTDFAACLECVKWWAEAEARFRYIVADAMLRAREVKQ